MDFQTQISFHEVPHSKAAEARILGRISRLPRFCKNLISCRVVVEFLDRRHQQGNLFQIRVAVRVPRQEIVVGANGAGKHADPNLYVAIRNTFDALERRLSEFSRQWPQLRRQRHEIPPEAKVLRLHYEGDDAYGFLETPEGREVYFHKNSVLNNHFDDLKVGSKVRFSEEIGEEGPQATSVKFSGI